MPYPENTNRGLSVFGALTVLGSLVASLFAVGAISVSGGKALNVQTSATSSVAFASINPGMCSSTTMTVTGARTQDADPMNGQSVSVGLPANILPYVTSTAWYGFVSATDTVTVVGCDTSSTLATPTFPAGVFRATVQGFKP